MKNNTIRLFTFIAVIAFTSLTLYAQDEEFNILSLKNRIEFGNNLFCTGDYIRAFDEYKDILRKQDIDTVRFKAALSLRELGRYSEANDYFKSLFFESNLDNEAELEYFKTLYLSGDYQDFKEEYRSSNYKPLKYENELGKLRSIISLTPGEAMLDSASFVQPFEGDDSIQMLKLYMRKKYPERKSPVKAALLSAVIPGLGKVYTKEYTDGITSFLLTGILGYIAVDNLKADHNFRGGLFAALTAYFYAGNIYGSAASAQIYNAQVSFNMQSDLKILLNNNNNFMPAYNFLCQ